jgi:hypothetical protein
MRRALIALFLLACCGSLFALEFFPPAPDSQTYLKIRTQTPYCSVQSTDVAVQGTTITVTVTPNPVPCAAILYPLQVSVGVLPAGSYAVVIKTAGGPEIERSNAIIRDASAGVFVSPVGVRADGGRTVQVFGVHSTGTVLFDGVAVTDAHFEHGSLVVTPPAHAPGTVDVTAIDDSGTRKAVAAFTYYDPEAEPDPFVLEPLLFPVAYDGPGIFGSLWTTNNIVATGRTLVRFRDVLPARTCSVTCSQFDWSGTLSPQSQSGLLVWAVRRRLPLGVEDDFHVASRVVDTSQPHGNGTGLPVARENDLRSTFIIDDVPFTGSARALLRIYSPVAKQQTAVVTVKFANETLNFPVTLRPINGVAYAALDLVRPPYGRDESGSVSVTMSGAKGWGLVSVTDNTTQEVTAFWPQ